MRGGDEGHSMCVEVGVLRLGGGGRSRFPESVYREAQEIEVERGKVTQ